MPNHIWLVAWKHYDDNYDYEWKTEPETEFGYFTTEAAAQAKAEEQNAGNRKSHAQAVEAAERKYAIALADYEDRKKKWEDLQKFKAKHPEMPDLVNAPNPRPPQPAIPSWGEWTMKHGGYYEPYQLAEASS